MVWVIRHVTWFWLLLNLLLFGYAMVLISLFCLDWCWGCCFTFGFVVCLVFTALRTLIDMIIVTSITFVTLCFVCIIRLVVWFSIVCLKCCMLVGLCYLFGVCFDCLLFVWVAFGWKFVWFKLFWFAVCGYFAALGFISCGLTVFGFVVVYLLVFIVFVLLGGCLLTFVLVLLFCLFVNLVLMGLWFAVVAFYSL